MKTKQINKTEWKEIELGEICEIKKGKSITKATLTKGEVPVIAGGQKPAYYHNKSNREGETITVSGSGAYAGFVAYFDVPIFASDCSTIQADNKNVFMKYVYYFLKSKQKNIYDLQKGIAQPHIYPKQIQAIKIPLPPLETQKEIVSILEKGKHLKEKRKNIIEQLDDYLKSIFNKLFLKGGFPNEELKSVAEIIMGQSPPGESYNNFKKGMPFFQGKTEFTERYAEVKKWTTKPSKIAEPESILISVRAPVGDVNLCPTKSCIGRGLASIVTKEKLSSDYLYSFLKLNKERIADLGSGSTFKAITSKQLSSLKIPIPPKELQQKFELIVECVEKLKEKEKQSLKEIEQLNGVLMQKAFRGELVK